MMAFGWRPQSSCYVGSGGGSQSSSTPGSTTCPSVTWFYVLLGGFVAYGFSGRRKRAA